jgi:hypothetical protein
LQGSPLQSFATEELYTYTVSRNGNNIGQMKLSRKISGEDVHLTIKSEVKTRFIMNINVNTIDQAQFNDGTLLYSTVLRTVNGNEKDAKKTRLINNKYEIQSGSGSVKPFKGHITYNMMMLYFKEPVGITQVYSDSFQQFISINRIGEHIYRLNLPDGNYNDYHFQKGICSKVSVHHSLYEITIKLVK